MCVNYSITFQAVCVTAYGGKKMILLHHWIHLSLLFSLSIMCTRWTSDESLTFFSFLFFISLFPPRKSCFALYIFILALQGHFLLILSLIFFIFICFVLIHFSILLFQLHPPLISLFAIFDSHSFDFIFLILLIYLLLVFQNQSF